MILKTFCSTLNSWIGELENSFFDVTNRLIVVIKYSRIQLLQNSGWNSWRILIFKIPTGEIYEYVTNYSQHQLFHICLVCFNFSGQNFFKRSSRNSDRNPLDKQWNSVIWIELSYLFVPAFLRRISLIKKNLSFILILFELLE